MISKLQMLTVSILVVSGFILPLTAQAETSASVNFANMYLWRGQSLTPDGAAVSGSVDYKMAGAYAGVWGSSEENGMETDLYLGYGQSFGNFSFDISYWKYLYPDEVDKDNNDSRIDLADNDASDIVLSAGFGPITAAAYIAVESGADSDVYYTLTGSMGKFSLMYGFWTLENPGDSNVDPTVGGDEYGHIQLGFQANDNLSFAVSKAFSSDDKLNSAVEEDPLFLVSYGLSFDLGKKQ